MSWKSKEAPSTLPKGPSAVPCASCGKPVRLEAAMSRDGEYWHQQCEWPKRKGWKAQLKRTV